TTLNIMVRKEYLSRKQEGKSYLFSPRVRRDSVRKRMLGDVVQRVFDGSVKATLMNLFDHSEIDPSELEELQRLIDRKVREKSE
ncbi:MAG: BlaI/MecI/CopY family transcriptional regulator, partial [Planctomycetota bacterium]